MLTRQFAEVEVVSVYLTHRDSFIIYQQNYMNSVERVVHYSRGDIVEREAPFEIPETKPPPEWPTHGAIKFKDVSMSYRPGLPNVLHGISMDIRPGEKIGIGKSS